jgi:HPC2 and ubinuclein domain
MNKAQRGIGGGGGGVGGEMSRSSTADLSSPLSEPEQQPQSFPSPSQQLSNNHEATQFPDSTIHVDPYGGENRSTAASATAFLRHTSNPQSQPQQSQPQSQPSIQVTKDDKPKTKRPRKKALLAAGQEKEKKEKPGRKPRASLAAGGPARKKAKLEAASVAHDGQSEISDYATPLPTASATAPAASIPANPSNYPIRTHDTPSVDAHSTNQPPLQRQTSQPTSPAPVSRLSYDPVRSMMVERNPTPKVYSTAPPTTTTPSKSVPVRTSSSPVAISHIVDQSTKLHFSVQPTRAQAPSIEHTEEALATKDLGASTIEVDSFASRAANQVNKISSEVPSTAPSPKPARAKEQPPPLPQGSGLVSSALFSNTTGEAATSSDQIPNIIVHVKLKNNDNNIINFAQLAEQKYGFAALHPRLAAQKERLARVAAAGAALERSANGSRIGGTSAGESGDDDLSVDIDRDSDNDGDVAMTGVNGGGTGANSGTDATGTKRRRRKKVEEYDQDDPFVDDSELAWEAQAAAVKDGFFVYCGPLVAEGEKAAVERYVLTSIENGQRMLTKLISSADGTVKRGRGRGRGGGPGSRGGRGGTAAAAAAANGEAGSGRGGGLGSRGGTTTRKPRVTKASRAIMEREKQDREKMAPLAAKPSGYPNLG